MGEAPDLREAEDCPSPAACDASCDQHDLEAALATVLRDHVSHLGASGPRWNADCLATGCTWTDHGNHGGLPAAMTAHRVHVADEQSAAIAPLLTARTHAAKMDTLRDARRVITQYLATSAKWRYDRVCWAFAIMLGEIPEDSPEPLSPADEADLARRSPEHPEASCPS